MNRQATYGIVLLWNSYFVAERTLSDATIIDFGVARQNS